MKKLLGTINRRGSQATDVPIAKGDSPEANIARGVRLFCESGGPNNSGEEVLHLPVIVEAAESSPTAARDAAIRIRKFLSKENFHRANVQYNALMLVRILADNPGRSFTKYLDTKFVITVKELLRDGRDMSVQQILRETLDTFEAQKADDPTLAPLREMWKKEKQKLQKHGNGPMPRTMNAPMYSPNLQRDSYQQSFANQQNYFARSHRPHGLPPPHELAQRIEEARTSAKLLLQVVQSTPPHEVVGNELIKEFIERCQSASRSVQSYIHSDNPPPDEDTLLTLIETNDQLATAMSRYQRALLQARRATGTTSTPSPPAMPPRNGPLIEMPSHVPPTGASLSLGQMLPEEEQQNPFDDHHAAHNESTRAAPQPHDYGMPPQTVPEQYNEHPMYQATPNYLNRQGSSSNNLAMYSTSLEAEPASPELEVRKPVQYRF